MLGENDVHGQVLELAVLVLGLLHAPQLAHAKAAIDLLSAVVYPPQDANPADHFSQRRARLSLPQRVDNLFINASRLLHGMLLHKTGSQCRKTNSQSG